MAEYTQQLNDINQSLNLIAGDVHTLVAGDPDNQIVDLLTGQQSQLSRMDDILTAISNGNQIASAGGTIDYSSGIDSICKSIAYTDLFLLVIAVILALLFGAIVGRMITSWMRGRNG